jgi:hypothetical protein
VIESAIHKASQNIEEEIPKTSYSFETRAKALSSDPPKLLAYMRLISVDQLIALFAKTQVGYDLFKAMTEALKLCESREYIVDLLAKLPSTHTFHLTVMFLGRADKATVKELIGEATDLYQVYKIKP